MSIEVEKRVYREFESKVDSWLDHAQIAVDFKDGELYIADIFTKLGLKPKDKRESIKFCNKMAYYIRTEFWSQPIRNKLI